LPLVHACMFSLCVHFALASLVYFSSHVGVSSRLIVTAPLLSLYSFAEGACIVCIYIAVIDSITATRGMSDMPVEPKAYYSTCTTPEQAEDSHGCCLGM